MLTGRIRLRRGAVLAGGIVLGIGAGLLTPGAATAAPAAACTWVAQQLPDLVDGAKSDVRGSDGAGTFAGASADHAVLWRAGAVVDLGPGAATDVNRHGLAVGYVDDADFRRQPMLWRGGAAVPLAVPAGATDAQAVGINDAGWIVGSAQFSEPTFGQTAHPVVWSAGAPGQVRDLGPLDGEEINWTALTGVTEQGVVVGLVVANDTLAQQAVVGTVRGGLRRLPTPVPGSGSEATGAAGRFAVGSVVGWQAVRWVGGRPQLLTGGRALAVNSSGTAVGVNAVPDGQATVWPVSGAPVELPTPAGALWADATTVTEDGTVAGFGYDGVDISAVTWSCR